jgi:hypothetical protein
MQAASERITGSNCSAVELGKRLIPCLDAITAAVPGVCRAGPRKRP